MAKWLAQMGRGRALLIGGVGLALVVGLVMLAMRPSSAGLAYLYTDLDPSAAQAISEKLKAQNVEFQISPDGSAILAPQDRLAELRMSLAGDQLGGKIGYDVLDAEQPFGLSASREKMNETRAIEGELARSISTLQAVSSARVHIVMPDKAIFAREERKASAAVTLKTRSRLSSENIEAIRSLVAASVPDLSPEAISIIDAQGRLLARAGQAGEAGAGEIDERQLATEDRLRTDIEQLLEPIVGVGKVRALSTSMRTLTSDSIDISLDDVTTARFGDFMDRVTLPAMIAVVRVEQWENYGIVTVDSGLIYAIVDALLGGKRGSQIMIDGRDFTTIETALVARVLNLALSEFTVAFSPIAAIHINLERIETNPRFAAIARPSNIGAICTFRVDIDGRGGRFSMMFPQATIEPVRDKLAQRFMGEKAGAENIWPDHMRQQMLATEVELAVLLGEIGMTLEQVQALEVGQNLSFHTEAAQLMDMQCGGLKLAQVRAGQRRGSLAVSLATPVSRETMR